MRMNLEDAAVLADAAEASTYASTPNTRALAEHYINTPEGNRLHYYESGAGRDVILIHGALVTADDPIIALHDLGGHMAGGIDNPLGARALYLGSSLYRIHGSNE